MDLEKYEDTKWECHECGNMKKCYLIWFTKLCQHFVSLCPECLEKLIEILNKGACRLPMVNEAFVEERVNEMEQMFMQKSRRDDKEYFIRKRVLTEAGVKIVGKGGKE